MTDVRLNEIRKILDDTKPGEITIVRVGKSFNCPEMGKDKSKLGLVADSSKEDECSKLGKDRVYKAMAEALNAAKVRPDFKF